MFFSKKKPRLSIETALAARPLKIVDAAMKPLPEGGGMLTVNLQPRPTARWLFRLPAGSAKTYEFDAIGVFVWESIDGKTSVEQIVKKLASRYDLNLREAQVPTLSFMEMLIKRGLVGVPLEIK